MSAAPLETCPKCGCREMFLRKAFPQKLGLAIIVLAGGIFLVLAAWRALFWIGAIVLLIGAIFDAILFAIVPTITVCYRCRAEFRGPLNPKHHGFELAVGEKYRHLDQDKGTRGHGDTGNG